MQGLMQDEPLTLTMLFNRAEQLWSAKSLASAALGPDAPGAGPDGIRRTTYGAWADRTRRAGGVLDALGVTADGRVGTYAWNSDRHLELYFAAPCTGRVLHTLNIRLFAEQLIYIANHAEDEVIFADRSLLDILWPVIDELRTVRHVVVMDDGVGDLPDDPRIVDYEELLAAAAPADFDGVRDERQAASMCYTSGTTGNPKGVVYSHRSVVLHTFAALMTDVIGLSERDVLLPVVPMFHANAWGLCQAAVAAGSAVVFPGRDLSARAVADLIVDEQVTLAAAVPTIWMGCLPLLEGRDTSHMRTILCGGSAVPKALAEAYRVQLGVPIRQAWGMTETSPIATIAQVRSDLAHRSEDEQADIRATQGIPAPGVELRIAGPDGDVLPWDGKQSGEVQVRGPWIASSYYNDERSPESFTADGWLRTGDVGFIDPDAYLHLVDRTKDVIKSGGEWISSVDLENEIMAHPAVAEAAVIAVPSARWMERPMACVVLKPGRTLTQADVLEWLRPRVAKWWLPDVVEFIDEVPKTSVGKFSKRTLRDRFAAIEVP